MIWLLPGTPAATVNSVADPAMLARPEVLAAAYRDGPFRSGHRGAPRPATGYAIRPVDHAMVRFEQAWIHRTPRSASKTLVRSAATA